MLFCEKVRITFWSRDRGMIVPLSITRWIVNNICWRRAMAAETFTISITITSKAMIRLVWDFLCGTRSSVISGCHLKDKKNVCRLVRAEDTTSVADTESKLDQICINSKPNWLKEHKWLSPYQKIMLDLMWDKLTYTMKSMFNVDVSQANLHK
jgi:hypothetical protein